MSNERFDRLMKQNLESVRPGYQPSAWSRFRKRLPLGFWASLLPYGGWVLSALMLTGWMTTLYTLNTNQLVIKQLTKTLPVRTESVNLTPAPSAPAAPAVSTHRVDTVYVVQRTVVEHRYIREREANVQISGNQESNQVRSSNDPANRRQSRSEREADSARSGGILEESKPLAAPHPTTSDTDKRDQPSWSNTSGSRPDKPGSGDVISSNQARQILPSPTKGSIVDSANRVITEATAAIPVDSNQTLNGRSTLTKVDSVTQKPAKPEVIPSASEPAKESRPPFRLSSLQPRIGIETGATLDGVGVGPAIEFFPTENLGLSVGVQASQLQLEEHKELRDFNAATGAEFIEKYRAFLPAQYDQIKDISVRTSLVSLPVNLKYYVPLRRNWSLLFQTGTSFDIAAYQQVRYESYYQGNEQYHSFEVDAQPRFFHNFMFGAGVQYRRPRISAQLSPYYLYDFRSIVNTPAGSKVGIKASVWLDLFK
ncbi:hypothetical protein ACAW74_28135 [Fibrella sp. WM1]|uniref:hypothetical protein n=1 Tax=Fibrella musci TaxID=3242485 RepID=UPI00352186A5